ncbi:MAG TPA: lysophospholipid acyltransferase family protein [Isosphaeraceae bacterium]|nr:lysophospholipid acyltransferase family protein [Isosphaeraceae bacterium]
MERRGLNIRKYFLGMILPILRRLPLPVASRMIAGIGRAEYALFEELRVAFDAAVARGAERLGCSWDVAEVGRALCGNQVRFRARDRLLDGVPDRRVEPLFLISGRDRLDEAGNEGKGVILLSSHFGGHLLPAHWLYRQGYPLRFYMERPRHISKYLTRQFETDGPLGQGKLFITRSKDDPTTSACSILRAARVLSAGMLIYLAGDVRWSGQNTQAARFLGRTYRFSATWVRLAALTGAPVVPVFCQMRPEGTYRIEFCPPFRVPEDAPRTGQTLHWVQSFLELLEEQVRLYPDNSNEYFFWPESDEVAARPPAPAPGSAGSARGDPRWQGARSAGRWRGSGPG